MVGQRNRDHERRSRIACHRTMVMRFSLFDLLLLVRFSRLQFSHCYFSHSFLCNNIHFVSNKESLKGSLSKVPKVIRTEVTMTIMRWRWWWRLRTFMIMMMSRSCVSLFAKRVALLLILSIPLRMQTQTKLIDLSQRKNAWIATTALVAECTLRDNSVALVVLIVVPCVLLHQWREKCNDQHHSFWVNTH